MLTIADMGEGGVKTHGKSADVLFGKTQFITKQNGARLTFFDNIFYAFELKQRKFVVPGLLMNTDLSTPKQLSMTLDVINISHICNISMCEFNC